ncbi:MAG: XRE family transcriptional regulator [Thermodesulfovibrionales bacterium]|nr:XRE family transcriptional regulator [Thermodesulfovibrionales bacterium]
MTKKEVSNIVGQNLQRLLNERGISQNKLAVMLGIQPPYINSIIKGKRGIGKNLLPKFCNVLDVTADAFYLPLGVKPAVSVPVLARVPAGFPKDTPDEDIIEHLSLPTVPKGTFSVIIKGDSMMPEIRDGDYALFLPTKDVKNGDIVIVANEYGEAMVKRFRVKDGKPLLESDNPEYPTFKPNKHYRIIGKVIKSVRVKEH